MTNTGRGQREETTLGQRGRAAQHDDHEAGQGDDPHVFFSPLEPGDPGPGVFATLQHDQVAALLTNEARVGVDRDDHAVREGSLGFVDRFFVVRGKLGSGTLIIRVDGQACTGVAIESLRVFRLDEESASYELVYRSGLGQSRDYVWAELDQPGRYAVIGLPSNPLVARTLAVMRELAGVARLLGGQNPALADRICELVLCAPDLREAMRDPHVLRGLVEDNLRRGFTGPAPGSDGIVVDDVCERCLALHMSRGAPAELPEFQIWPQVRLQASVEGGRWDVLPESSQVLAVHAAMLHNGRVLYFSGSEHDQDRNAAGDVDHSRLWDPATGTIHTVASPSHDLFCCGQALLADGRLLAAGGTVDRKSVV